MNDTKVQWHPGFVAAMNLELAQNRADLIFEKEYNLNTKPLEIDLLVVKKNASVDIANEIGKLFRGHNIMEYKSPEDHLDIDDFYKTGAYASLYKSYGETVDEIKEDDVTVTKELADSVLEVSIGANKRIVEELIGDDSMCQALMEIMEPVIQLRDQENVEKGLKKGIRLTIDTLREFGHGDAEIKEAIMRKYEISDEEMEGYL